MKHRCEEESVDVNDAVEYHNDRVRENDQRDNQVMTVNRHSHICSRSKTRRCVSIHVRLLVMIINATAAMVLLILC